MSNTPTSPLEGWARRYTPVLYVVGGTCLICLLGLAYAVLFKGLAMSAGNVNATTDAVVRLAPTPDPSVAATTRQSNARSNTSVAPEVEIRNLLDGWVGAARAHDLDAQMRCYADTLDVYYKYQGVSKDRVWQDRQRAFQKYSSLDVSLSDISITVDRTGATATATFDKIWNFSGEKSFSGSVRQMLWLSKVGGYWLITGEKDLKVHYVNS